MYPADNLPVTIQAKAAKHLFRADVQIFEPIHPFGHNGFLFIWYMCNSNLRIV